MKTIRAPLIVGFILRALLPWFNHGFRYMDEHWQVIEPAQYILHKTWSQTIEWREGLRSWIYPAFISVFLKISESIFNAPLWQISFTRACLGVLSTIAIWIVYQSICHLDHTPKAKHRAYLGAWMIALWPFALYCSNHTHGEMTGAIFIAIGALLPFGRNQKKLNWFFSGLSFGIAIAFKVDVAIAGLGLGVWCLLTRRIKESLLLALGALGPVLCIGIVDYFTWGHFFQSVLGHAKVNLVDGVGNQWGVSPWYVHLFYFFDITSVITLVGAILFFKSLAWDKKIKFADPLSAYWFMNFFFVAVYCAIPHKEKRFLAPLVYTGIAAGLASLQWIEDFKNKKNQLSLIIFILGALAIHLLTNINTYIIDQPWQNRILAIHDAGKIKEAQAMISPQWPAQFYLPRNIPAFLSGDDASSISKILSKISGLKKFSVASDWQEQLVIQSLGYNCVMKTNIEEKKPVPRAWLCEKK